MAVVTISCNFSFCSFTMKYLVGISFYLFCSRFVFFFFFDIVDFSHWYFPFLPKTISSISSILYSPTETCFKYILDKSTPHILSFSTVATFFFITTGKILENLFWLQSIVDPWTRWELNMLTLCSWNSHITFDFSKI